MAQTSTWSVTLVYDALAFEGFRWWAHAEPTDGEWKGYGVATRLCNDPLEALAAIATKMDLVVEAATRQEEQAQQP